MKLNWKRIGLVFFAFLIIVVGIVLACKGKGNDTGDDTQDQPSEPVAPKKLQIFDEDSKSRPIAVMINNHHSAWPQSGLQDAYLVYEIMTEGGITRMLALYKDADTAKIGAVRSSRHYFLDYALENDAIYVHFGWSPQAQSDIAKYSVNNINGLYDSGFWRDTTLNRDYEHTAFTSIDKLKETATRKGYRMESDKDMLLDYSVDEIDLSVMDKAEVANNVDIVYSTYQTSSYEYDEANKVYKRSMSGVKNTDLVTGKQYTVKNIITYKVRNYSIDSYGRQDLENTGNGEGYYITDGYAVPITWEKKDRFSQTVYRYLDGTEIKVNDGNTYIQIQPTGQNLKIY